MSLIAKLFCRKHCTLSKFHRACHYFLGGANSKFPVVLTLVKNELRDQTDGGRPPPTQHYRLKNLITSGKADKGAEDICFYFEFSSVIHVFCTLFLHIPVIICIIKFSLASSFLKKVTGKSLEPC